MTIVNKTTTVNVMDRAPVQTAMYQNGKMSTEWIRWFDMLFNRVGSGSGNLIYDTATIAAANSTSNAQISQIRAELDAEIKNQILFAINQLAQNKTELPPLIPPAQAAAEQFPPIGFMALIPAIATTAAGTVTLDQVLNNGSISSHSLTTGALTIASGNIQTNGLSTSYGTTSGVDTGGVNVVQGTGASATWLISGTSGGTFRAGIQVLDAGGAVRLYEGSNHYDFVAGALAVPGNITSSGSTIKVSGAANTQFQLGNTSNAQLWEFGYNTASTVAGVYDRTATAFRLTFNDTTGEAKFPAGVASTNTTTGTVIVTGGVGVSGMINAGSLKASTIATTSPSTVNAATYTVTATDTSLVFTTTACTVTLPAAASFPGRILYVKNVTATAITSAASDVVPLASTAAGTAILAATAGKFAMLHSDGVSWITMMAN